MRIIGPGPLQLVSERVKPTRCCPGRVGKRSGRSRMPPKNVRVARPAAAVQRATRRVTRSSSQASSEAESRREAAPENGNPVEMPNAVNTTLLAELQRYRDAYGGQLPNVEATAEAGDNPIPPGAGECRTGACYNCGERGHMAKECPKVKRCHRRRCYRCGQEGHLSWDCPTLQGENAGGAQPQQQIGQAARPRAYAVEGHERAEPIAGSVAVGGVMAFTLFDTWATHSFVSPKLTREWNFKGNFNTMVMGVETAGTEKMAMRGRYEEPQNKNRGSRRSRGRTRPPRTEGGSMLQLRRMWPYGEGMPEGETRPSQTLWDCPTLQGENAGGAQPQQQRGQAARPRAYAVEGREGAEPIAGMSLI
ncbi:hypothetical protein F2Q69_00011143 [Brassica cretica]|uniref:CCHC-type domain-containing protein n=1 Tax=Brassica cretica TaxID=69181 RepID=A0A8S9QYN3_BRACR|nr:hypothetical protein F2Q69_00011143 [Brassica cretica]